MKMKMIFVCAILLFAPVVSRAQDNRPILTVLDFKSSGISEAEVELFIDLISSHVVDAGKYRVIDRRQREALLEEIEFSQSDCTDEVCQLEIGKLLSADYIIVGSVGNIGNRYLLNIQLLRVETGETLKSSSEVYATVDDLVDDSGRLVRLHLTNDLAAKPTPRAQPKDEEKREPKVSSSQTEPFERKRIELEQQLAAVRRKQKTQNTIGWELFCGGLVLIAGAVTIYYLGTDLKKDYDSAQDQTTAEDLRRKLENFVIGFNVCWIIGSVFTASVPVVWLTSPKTKPIEEEIRLLDQELRRLASTANEGL